MKAFLMGIAVLAVVSAASAAVLSWSQQSSQVAYSDKSSVRQ